MITHPRLVIPSIRDLSLVVSGVGNSSVAVGPAVAVGTAVAVLPVVGFSYIEVLKIGKAALAVIVAVRVLPVVVVVVRSLVVVFTSVVGIICSCHLGVSLPNRNLDLKYELFLFHIWVLFKPHKGKTVKRPRTLIES